MFYNCEYFMSDDENDDDVIRIVIDVFNQVFNDFNLPACICIVDGQTGLVITHTGEDCPSSELFEGQIASVLQAFEALKARFETSFNEKLNLFTLEFYGSAYYVDNLKTKGGAELYLIARSSYAELLSKARPFLTNIVQQIEMMFQVTEKQE